MTSPSGRSPYAGALVVAMMLETALLDSPGWFAAIGIGIAFMIGRTTT